MREQRKSTSEKKQTNKQNKKKKQKLQDNTHQLSPSPTPCYKSTTTHLTHPPIICNNNTMDIEFLVQMRQSDKCGSVRNDDVFNVDLE